MVRFFCIPVCKGCRVTGFIKKKVVRRGGLCCPMNPLAVPFSTPFVVIGFQTARELSLSITHFIYVPRRETMDYLCRQIRARPRLCLLFETFRIWVFVCQKTASARWMSHSLLAPVIFTGMLGRIFPLGFFVSFVCPVDFYLPNKLSTNSLRSNTWS